MLYFIIKRSTKYRIYHIIMYFIQRVNEFVRLYKYNKRLS